MTASLEQSLRAAAIATFEQLVFLLPDVPPDELQRRRPLQALATVAFTGPAQGLLQVHAGEGLLPRLTANMMGTDVASEALQLDALGEIANIICGQVFPALDPVSAFEQTPPQVVPCTDVVAPPVAMPAARIELGLDASRADVRLYLFTQPATWSAS